MEQWKVEEEQWQKKWKKNSGRRTMKEDVAVGRTMKVD